MPKNHTRMVNSTSLSATQEYLAIVLVFMWATNCAEDRSGRQSPETHFSLPVMAGTHTQANFRMETAPTNAQKERRSLMCWH